MAPISKLLWGSSLENELRFGYPVYGFLSDREERVGSQHETSAAGIDSSWIVGRDYILDAEVRWIPDGPTTAPVQTPVSGPVSWQAFLDWARDAGVFRFVPDETVPNFYVDNVALVEPRKGFGSLSADIKRNVRLKLRNPTVDFHQALRGVMFEYAPGASLLDPVAATFSRSTAATRRGLPGTLAAAVGASDLSGVLRDRHYEGALRTTLLEAARTQLVTDPENFGNWTNSGTPVNIAAGQADPFGGTAAYTIQDDDAGVEEGKFQTVAFTADGEKCISVFVRAGTAGRLHLGLWDNTASAWRHRANIVFTAGVPALNTGTGVGTLFPIENWGAGWYRISISALGVVAANTNQIFIRADAVATVGTWFMFGANAWNATFPSSYQGPSLTTRNADLFNWPLSIRNQPLAIYVDWIERGTFLDSVSRDIWALTGPADGDPRFVLLNEAGTAPRIYYSADLGVTSRRSTGNTIPTMGQEVEALALLRSDGAVNLIEAVNAGAEFAGGYSAASSLTGVSFTVLALGSAVAGGSAGFCGLRQIKIMPLIFGGQTIDTIAKARAV